MKKNAADEASEDVYLRCVLDANNFRRTLPQRVALELALAERLMARLAWLPYLFTVIGLAVGLFAFASVCASGASETHLCVCTGLPACSAAAGSALAYCINARQYKALANALRIRHDLLPLLRVSTEGDHVLRPILRRIERCL